MSEARLEYKERLFFRSPAKHWDEAFPIGNGRLGAMIFGGPCSERLQLNEDSLWYGGPRDRHNPDALVHLPEIRRLIFEGKLKEAESLASLALTAIPETQRHYVPLGDLFLHFQTLDDNQVIDYERELDLSEAVVSISFKAGKVQYRRKIFASYPDGVIVIRLTADTPGQISFTARMGRERFRYVDHIRTEEGNSIIMSGNSGGGVNYCGVLMCKPEGGQMRTIGEHLVVTNADAVTLVISAATDFRESDPESASFANAKRAASRTYIDLLTAHIEDYCKLFQRTSLRLDAAFKAMEQDTSKRLEQMKAGARRPRTSSFIFSVWPLSAYCFKQTRIFTCEFARDLE